MLTVTDVETLLREVWREMGDVCVLDAAPSTVPDTAGWTDNPDGTRSKWVRIDGNMLCVVTLKPGAQPAQWQRLVLRAAELISELATARAGRREKLHENVAQRFKSVPWARCRVCGWDLADSGWCSRCEDWR